MACSCKARRAKVDTDESPTESTARTVRRVVRGVVVRAVIASAITAVARRVAARRRADADAARLADDARATSRTAAAEWAPLVDRASRTIAAADDTAPWIDPVDGQCPLSHPVKGNASSNIYHEPGSRFYDMTTPERCYRDAAAAEADGMRAPKR